MITQTTVRPSVWIGCLACYNEGILNGRWFPAEEAGEVTPEDLHLGLTAHDELWIFDHEGFPRGTGEMSPDTAQLWGESSMRSEKNSGLHCSHGLKQAVT